MIGLPLLGVAYLAKRYVQRRIDEEEELDLVPVKKEPKVEVIQSPPRQEVVRLACKTTGGVLNCAVSCPVYGSINQKIEPVVKKWALDRNHPESSRHLYENLDRQIRRDLGSGYEVLAVEFVADAPTRYQLKAQEFDQLIGYLDYLHDYERWIKANRPDLWERLASNGQSIGAMLNDRLTLEQQQSLEFIRRRITEAFHGVDL